MSNNNPILRQAPGTTVLPGDRLGNVHLPRQKHIQLLPGKGTYVRQGHVYSSCFGRVHVHHLVNKDGADADAGGDGDGGVDDGTTLEKWMVSVVTSSSSSTTTSSSKSGGLTSLQGSYSNTNTTMMSSCPSVGMTILGRITRVVRPSHAMVDIMAIVPTNDHDTDDCHQNNQQQQQQQQQQQNNNQNNHHNNPLIIPLHEPYQGTIRQNDIRPNSSLEIDISDCLQPGDVVLAKIHAMGGSSGGGGGGGGGSGDAFILTTAEAELGVIQAMSQVSGWEMIPISWKEMECPVSGVKEGRKVAKPR